MGFLRSLFAFLADAPQHATSDGILSIHLQEVALALNRMTQKPCPTAMCCSIPTPTSLKNTHCRLDCNPRFTKAKPRDSSIRMAKSEEEKRSCGSTATVRPESPMNAHTEFLRDVSLKDAISFKMPVIPTQSSDAD